jgi:hypothetical protein
MTLDVFVEVAHKFRHPQHQEAVHVLPVAMELRGTHPRLALDEH